MDIKNYIESGILEQYVLGGLSLQEAAEVERYTQLSPSVKEELSLIERTLESYATLHAQTPPPDMLGRILQQINAQPVPAGADWLTRMRPRNWARFLAVAMTVKFLVATTGLVLLYLQNQSLHERVADKQQQINRTQVNCDSVSNHFQREVRFLKDIETRPIVMRGAPESPTAIAAVYTNPQTRKTYLGNLQLPALSVGKQYQLWAIVDGKPTDMGMIETNATGSVFIEVPFIENAQAFAISLEKTGGNPQPTQVVVIGNAS